MASEADSPLSSVPSEDEMADEVTSTPARSTRPSVETQHEHDTPSQPPAKKRKTGPGGFHNWNANDGAAAAASTSAAPEPETDVDLSEDSEGSAPGSPSLDEYALRADQVTACQWESCPVGDLGNSDDLIKHVQDDHISPKRAKYTCEWGECARKGAVHPSGYALKAHMRSHTKEKPFFCALPECDRSFTRSDALAKHMRTVHEPEPAKQSASAAAAAAGADASTSTPVPKKGPKIRLHKPSAATVAANAAAAAALAAGDPTLDPKDPNYDPSPSNDNIQYIPARHPITGQPGFMITYPPDIHFSQFESEIPANQLVRLLRRQLHWAQGETAQLKVENDELEKVKQEEWRKKEALLQGVMGTELRLALEDDIVQEGIMKEVMEKDVVEAKDLTWTGEARWRERRKREDKAVAGVEDRGVNGNDGVGLGLDGQMDVDGHGDVDVEKDGESEAPATQREEEGEEGEAEEAAEEEEEDNGGSEAEADEDEEVDEAGETANDDADSDDKMDIVRQEEQKAQPPSSTSQADVERDAIDALMGMGGGRAG